MNWNVIETEIEKNTGNISLCRSYISVDSTKVIHFSKRIVTKISSESKCFKVFVGLDENLDYIIKMKFLKEHESNTIRLAFQKRKEHVSAKACSVKLVQSYIEKMFDDKRHCRADFIDDENLIVISKNKKDFDVSNVVWKEFVDPDTNKRMVSDKFVSFGQKKIIISKSLFDAAEVEYKYLQFLKGTDETGAEHIAIKFLTDESKNSLAIKEAKGKRGDSSCYGYKYVSGINTISKIFGNILFNKKKKRVPIVWVGKDTFEILLFS